MLYNLILSDFISDYQEEEEQMKDSKTREQLKISKLETLYSENSDFLKE